MQDRCARCQRDPYEAIGVRWGPLTGRQFWRNIGWRLLIALPFVGWVLWEEPESLVRVMQLSGWAQVVLGALLAVGGLVIGYHLWLTWRAAHVALVLTPSEVWLLQRRGGRSTSSVWGGTSAYRPNLCGGSACWKRWGRSRTW
jgi:hypothetical protein